MRKSIYIIVLGALAALIACTNKGVEKKDDTRVLMQDSTDIHGLQRMQVSKSEQDISFRGKEYHSYLQRVPNDSLSRVRSEVGDVYVDNEVTLRITRGAEKVFSKTFTKHSFSSLVDPDFMKKAILEGMVFDKTTPQGFVYAVSVCYPQTDLYIPISITVTPDGKMSMTKDELIEEIYRDSIDI